MARPRDGSPVAQIESPPAPTAEPSDFGYGTQLRRSLSLVDLLVYVLVFITDPTRPYIQKPGRIIRVGTTWSLTELHR